MIKLNKQDIAGAGIVMFLIIAAVVRKFLCKVQTSGKSHIYRAIFTLSPK